MGLPWNKGCYEAISRIDFFLFVQLTFDMLLGLYDKTLVLHLYVSYGTLWKNTTMVGILVTTRWDAVTIDDVVTRVT